MNGRFSTFFNLLVMMSVEGSLKTSGIAGLGVPRDTAGDHEGMKTFWTTSQDLIDAQNTDTELESGSHRFAFSVRLPSKFTPPNNEIFADGQGREFLLPTSTIIHLTYNINYTIKAELFRGLFKVDPPA
jgi:hypothetical protein